MHPEREDVYRPASGVIGWIDDVLEVQTSKHVLDYGGVVIDLTNPLR